jgi:hypothetical protein
VPDIGITHTHTPASAHAPIQYLHRAVSTHPHLRRHASHLRQSHTPAHLVKVSPQHAWTSRIQTKSQPTVPAHENLTLAHYHTRARLRSNVARYVERDRLAARDRVHHSVRRTTQLRTHIARHNAACKCARTVAESVLLNVVVGPAAHGLPPAAAAALQHVVM